MYPFQFSTVLRDGLDVIVIKNCPISLTVFPTHQTKFKREAHEMQFFCDHFGDLYILQTTGYSRLADPMHLVAIQRAPNWYAAHVLDNPDAGMTCTAPYGNLLKDRLPA
jgi:hypothetical protein